MTDSLTRPAPSLKAALASLDLTPEAELSYFRQQRGQAAAAPELADPADPLVPDIEAEQTDEQLPVDAPDPAPVLLDSEDTPMHLDATAIAETPIAEIVVSPPPPEIDAARDAPAVIEEVMAADPIDPEIDALPPEAIHTDPPDDVTIDDVTIVDSTFDVLSSGVEVDQEDDPAESFPSEQSTALVAQPSTDLMATDEMAMIEIDTTPDPDIEVPEGLAAPALPPSDFPQSYENYLDPSIEDYLESSEALLRHLEESTSPATAQRAPKSPKTPVAANATSAASSPKLRRFWILLGLLVLFGILGVGGLLIWRFNRGALFNWGSSSSPSPTVSASPDPGAAPASPAVSASPTPTSTPTPAPTVTPTETPAASPPPVPSPAPSVSPLEPPTVAPSPSPTAPAASPASTRTKFYIVTDFKDAETLANVRKIVPAAAEVEFAGQRVIQLGVRSSQADAEAMVKDLESKGLTASIRSQPEE